MMKTCTVAELANLLNIGEASIYRLLRDGSIENRKLKKNLYEILAPINHLIKKKKPASRKGTPYSEAEKQILNDHFNIRGLEFCHSLLSHRSVGAIRLQAHKMGLKPPAPDIPERYKYCSKCKLLKEDLEFGKDERRKAKLNVYCKLCLESLRSQPSQKKKKKNYDKHYSKTIRKHNPSYRWRTKLGKRIRAALSSQNCKKESKTTDLLGCSIDYFKKYLETKFKPGMTWENHGFYGWHIDHILPCSSFDLSDLEQQKLCFHYTNLQPLWWKENLRKGASIKLHVAYN